MVKILDVASDDPTVREALSSLRAEHVVFLRENGKIVAQLNGADEDDLEELIWITQPEQIERGKQAREAIRRGETVPLEQVKRELLGE